jgi:hypothetical protein
LIASHDAGGAEILSSWLNQNKPNAVLVVAGPAKKIFKLKCKKYKFSNLNEALKKVDWVLCSSGWSSKFEKRIIAASKKKGIKTVVFLDHWVNYLERFQIKENKYIFPDEIWVGDIYAKKIASSIFKSIPVILKKNPYFADIISLQKQKKKKYKKVKKTFLYVSEPKSAHDKLANYKGRTNNYDEHDAIKYFLSNLNSIEKAIDKVIFRKHPSENIKKYKWIQSVNEIKVSFSKSKSLISDINKADIVVGCETMAMVIGLLMNKRVISSVPPLGLRSRRISLPFKKIQKLSQLVKEYKNV